MCGACASRITQPFLRNLALAMSFLYEIRSAARLLWRRPGLVIVAILLLAAGIGASTLTFALFDAVFLRPLPLPDAHELVRFVTRHPVVGTRSQFPYQLYREWRDSATTIDAAFAEVPYTGVLTDPGPVEFVNIGMVTPEYFSALGVQALYGRSLTAVDHQAVAETPAAILSHAFWQRRFGDDTGVLGRSILVNNVPLVVVGIMPPGVNGVTVDTTPDIRIPSSARLHLFGFDAPTPADRAGVVDLAGRLKPGVTLAEAEAESRLVWRRTMEVYYRELNQMNGAMLARMLEQDVGLDPLANGVSILRERFGNALKVLFAGSGLVLLMVILNLASVAVARSVSRRHEMAVRLAVGAALPRLIRLMSTEQMIVVVPAAALGLYVAVLGTPILLDALPPLRTAATSQVQLVFPLGLATRVVAFVALTAILALISIVLPSTLVYRRLQPADMLRGLRTTRGYRGRRGLMMVQTALSVILLSGAALLVRTVDELAAVPTGFDEDHVATFTLAPALAGYSNEELSAYRTRLIERVRALPDVTAVSTSVFVPMRGSGIKMTVAPTGHAVVEADQLAVSMNYVAPAYFSAMGMQLLAGRDFVTSDDASEAPAPVVVNRALVRRYFPDVDPIGETFGTGQPDVAQASFRIIGVVNDAKYRSLREPIQPTAYVPDQTSSTLIVRTRSQARSVIEPVRREIESLDPGLPIMEVRTLADEVASSVAAERLLATLATVVALSAVVLTAVGIYGLFAQVVTERHRELSVRVALGATHRGLGLLIGREAALLILPGLAVGLVATLLGSRWIESLLYGIAPQDPRSLAAATLLVAFAGAAGTWIPARHALRTDAASGLRLED